MKKAVLAALVISTMLMGSVVAYAAPENNTEQPKDSIKATICIAAQTNLSELTGTVEEISGDEMKVKAKDGETYTVPLQGFVKQDSFKTLGLIKGTEVQLKSLTPEQMSVSDDKGVFQGLIKLGKAVEASMATIKAVDVNEKGTFEVVEGKDLPSTMDAVSCVSATVCEDGITWTTMTPSENMTAVYDTANFELGSIERLFLAGEITANGRTAKVQK